MGSLSQDGQPISHANKTVKNLGHGIEIVNIQNDQLDNRVVSFSPSKMSNLFFWLDGSDVDYVTRDSLNRVTAWTDKSSNSLGSCVQTLDLQKPIWLPNSQNGKSGIIFDSTKISRLLLDVTINLAFPYSIFVVAKKTNTTASQTVFWIGDKDDTEDYRRLSLRGSTAFASWSAKSTLTSSAEQFSTTTNRYTANVPCIIHGEDIHALSRKVRLNGGTAGVNTVNRPINPFNRICIGHSGGVGGDWPFDGAIYEVLILSGELSETDRLRIERYLATKWAVVLS